MIRLDGPTNWSICNQDMGTEIGERIMKIYGVIMWYLIIIIMMVIYTVYKIIRRDINISMKYLEHGERLEIIWTIIPGIILLIIAEPSFGLLYEMDEVIEAGLTIKIIGNQWYWIYEVLGKEIESYIKDESDLKKGELRMSEVDERLILPIKTQIRLIVTSNDVMHSFSVPSLGIKVDAIPGRLNQTSILLKREGLYIGACMEHCGVKHAYMPIVIEGVRLEKFIEGIKC